MDLVFHLVVAIKGLVPEMVVGYFRMGLLRVLGLFSYVRPIVFYLLNIHIYT